MNTHIEIPVIGKVKHPQRWLIGLMAAGILVVGSTTTYTLVNRGASREDIAALTIPVEAKDVTLRITASGKVVPAQSVNISPKQPGIVAELRVEQGDRVQKGQVLAVMDSADVNAQILQYQASLDQAKAQLAEAQAGSRPQEIAQARARLAQAQAQLDQARAGNRSQEIQEAQAQVDDAKAQVNLTQARVRRYRELARQGAIS
ncbi:efflux transporter periplasmic adaptor subunit, partial [Fischerella thermalis WC542]